MLVRQSTCVLLDLTYLSIYIYHLAKCLQTKLLTIQGSTVILRLRTLAYVHTLTVGGSMHSSLFVKHEEKEYNRVNLHITRHFEDLKPTRTLYSEIIIYGSANQYFI